MDELEFVALIRQLKTPHLYILRDDLIIPAEANLIKLVNKEISTRESEEHMPLCDWCPDHRDVKKEESVGFIPMPNEDKTIHLCAIHFELAKERCYFVLKNGQGPDTSNDVGFDKRTWAKHVQLRGSRDYKFSPWGVRAA